MINMDKLKVKILVSESSLAGLVHQSTMDLLKICLTVIPRSSIIKSSPRVNYTYRFFDKYNESIMLKINVELLQMLTYSVMKEIVDYTAHDVFMHLVDDEIHPRNKILKKEKQALSKEQSAIQDFTRLLMVKLWLDKVIILPLRMTTIKQPNIMLNELVKGSKSATLQKTYSIGINNEVEYHGDLTIEKRNERSNFWLRLLLNTSFYDYESISKEDVEELFLTSKKRENITSHSRYVVHDFLSFLAIDSEQLHSYLIDIFSRYNSGLTRNRSEIINSHPVFTRKKRKPKHNMPPRPKPSQMEWTRELYKSYIANGNHNQIPEATKRQNQVLDFILNDNSKSFTFTELLKNVINSAWLRKLYLNNFTVGNEHPIYSELPQVVRDFCSLIYHTQKAWIASIRNQNEQNSHFNMAFLLCYVSTYLPKFFIERDGDLRNYPTSFNTLPCGIFICRDEFIEKIMPDIGGYPKTLFQVYKEFADYREWQPSSHYARLIALRSFLEYIEERNTIIDNAEHFKCTISDSDMPLTSNRTTTVKKFIDREYFSTLISLLETLIYMTKHINGMADGVNCGISNGELKKVTFGELTELSEWSGIWGKNGSIPRAVNLSKLNYTPIILFNDKYYPLKYCHRFYSLIPYKINGTLCTRVSPHYVRVALLMALTGIRQKHIIWLDKDRFDAAMSNNNHSQLAPLIVSTDKAHGEWVSVVNKAVIDICLEQKEWYENCELEEFQEDLWYGFKENSKFGKFKPLFRMSSKENNWQIYEVFPKVLCTLQEFLKNDCDIDGFKDFVYWIPTNTKKIIGKKTLYVISQDEFKKENHNSSWHYELRSTYTPHGLRAAFVSDAIRFLPPELIGKYLTGQTESLVWYYAVMNPDDIGNHQELLLNLLTKNADSIAKGDAPELAQHIAAINAKLASEIEIDPSAAIKQNMLISLLGPDETHCGIEILKSKKHSKLAYNLTHICPFDNTCPKDIIEKYGLRKPCALCPYAIRGSMHLDAVNSLKFKNVELMNDYVDQIKIYKKRSKKSIISAELKQLENNHDFVAQEAAALEAIEQQLYYIYESNKDYFIAQNKDAIIQHYAVMGLDDAEYLFKRLCDAQTFSDFNSPAMQRKFAYLRQKLLVANDDIIGLLTPPEEPEHVLIASLIKSIMSAKNLSTKDIFNIAAAKPKALTKYDNIMARLGITGGKIDK